MTEQLVHPQLDPEAFAVVTKTVRFSIAELLYRFTRLNNLLPFCVTNNNNFFKCLRREPILH
jgi:hypothetical protein